MTLSVISVLGELCGSGALSLPAHGLYLHSAGHLVWRVSLEVGHINNKSFLGLFLHICPFIALTPASSRCLQVVFCEGAEEEEETSV